LKTATEKTKKLFLERMCDDTIEFHRIRLYDFMYVKRKELGWEENQEVQNTRISLSKTLKGIQ
jgi:hypothetical protein